MDNETQKPGTTEALREKVARAFDPSGETHDTVKAMSALVGDARVLPLLEQAGVDVAELRAMLSRSQNIKDVAVAAIEAFAPLGWAACNTMPVDAYADALQVLIHHGAGAAEEVVTSAWNETNLLRPVQQVRALGSGNPDLADIMGHRARLLTKAHEHHEHGSYEASIPILLAQIEGLVADVSGGKMLFSGHPTRAADVLDDAAIATLGESLPAVRALFSTNSRDTVADGGFGRHAVLHGRELAYDTKTNSTKCFVLLQAVVEWAQPVVRATIDQQHADEEARWAGSTEVDEDGRRRDQRQFTATRMALRHLHTCHLGHYNTNKRFRTDLLPIVERHFVKDGLPTPHGVTMHVTGDGQTWWAWRRTVTGWHLGIGATSRNSLWRYDAADAPTGGPHAVPAQWAEDGAHTLTPPNWP